MIQNAETYFPLFISLNQKRVLVFGGGKIATRRILTLLEFGAVVKVIAPKSSNKIMDLAVQKKLVLEQRRYVSGEIDNPYIVLATTDNEKVNEEIYEECKKKGILVNVASDQTKSDFFFPGIIKEDSLVIGVTASGKDHKRAKKVTEQIRTMVKERMYENDSYRK